jgi:hypothetical protein
MPPLSSRSSNDEAALEGGRELPVACHAASAERRRGGESGVVANRVGRGRKNARQGRPAPSPPSSTCAVAGGCPPRHRAWWGRARAGKVVAGTRPGEALPLDPAATGESPTPPRDSERREAHGRLISAVLTTPPKIILYYRLYYSIWHLSNDTGVTCHCCWVKPSESTNITTEDRISMH